MLYSKIGGRAWNRTGHTKRSPNQRTIIKNLMMITSANKDQGPWEERKLSSKLTDVTCNLHMCQHTELLKKATTKPKARHQETESNRLRGANRKKKEGRKEDAKNDSLYLFRFSTPTGSSKNRWVFQMTLKWRSYTLCLRTSLQRMGQESVIYFL